MRVAAGKDGEGRGPQQRREERRLGPAESARIAFRGGEFSVAVLNVSRRGTMIESGLLPQINEPVAIQFDGCNPLDCEVRWVRDGRIGLEFREETALLMPAGVKGQLAGGRRAGEIPAAASPHPDTGSGEGEGANDERPSRQATGRASSRQPARAPRQSLMWQGTIYWDDGSMQVSLRNISSGGAMVAAARNLKSGTDVVLAFKLAGSVPGKVQWCRAGQIGLAFERAFNVSKLIDPRRNGTIPLSTSARPGILKPLYLETELDADSPWAARWEKLRPKDLM